MTNPANPATPCPAFVEWRARRDALAADCKEIGVRWKAIAGNGAGPLGLTPDAVKRSPEWQACYASYWQAHRALARHNAAGVKRWRRELAQEQRDMRAALMACAA